MRKPQIAWFLLMVVATSLLSTTASGQSVANLSLMQLAKLTSSDGSAFGQFGSSVAISGNTVVVGASLQNRSEAYVFVKGSSGWTDMTETAKLVPSDGTAQFGPVAIVGNTVAVGSTGDTLNNLTSIYIFQKPVGGWTGSVTETAILSAGGANLGSEVALSNSAAVSGTANAAAYVFAKPAGGWKTTGKANATLDIPVQGTLYNPSVAVGGTTVAIGASINFGSEGTVYVYSEPSGGWSGTLSPTASLIASDGKFSDSLGLSVSISNNTVVAGAPGNNQAAGAAYVFVEPTGGWVSSTETAKLSSSKTYEIGYSVSISGNAVSAGAPFTTIGVNQFQGADDLFIKPSTGWKTTTTSNAQLTASDGAANDILGFSTAISGSTIVAGAPQATVNSNPYEGAVYVFGK